MENTSGEFSIIGRLVALMCLIFIIIENSQKLEWIRSVNDRVIRLIEKLQKLWHEIFWSWILALGILTFLVVDVLKNSFPDLYAHLSPLPSLVDFLEANKPLAVHDGWWLVFSGLCIGSLLSLVIWAFLYLARKKPIGAVGVVALVFDICDSWRYILQFFGWT